MYYSNAKEKKQRYDWRILCLSQVEKDPIKTSVPVLNTELSAPVLDILGKKSSENGKMFTSEIFLGQMYAFFH